MLSICLTKDIKKKKKKVLRWEYRSWFLRYQGISMVAAGGFLGTEHRAFSGPGSHIGLRVSLCWVCWAIWLVNCLLLQTPLNQLCLAWLSQHSTLAAVTGPEHWAKCQACCKIHWNFIWPLAPVPTRNTLAGTCSQYYASSNTMQASLGDGGGRQRWITDQICPHTIQTCWPPFLFVQFY